MDSSDVVPRNHWVIIETVQAVYCLSVHAGLPAVWWPSAARGISLRRQLGKDRRK